MHMNDTQKRKSKEIPEVPVYQADETKDKNRMTQSIFVKFRNSSNLTKIVVCSIGIVILFKCWQFMTYDPQTASIPDKLPAKPTPKWAYSSNHQGITEDELNDLLSDIRAGKSVAYTNAPKDTLAFADVDKPKQPYKSTGSLQFAGGQFTLDNKPFRFLSGAIHYFRVMPEYWEDSMKKLKACGLNTVETYVAWNLHEDSPGNYDFKGMLDLRKFIQTAHKLGLYVILRPGPYICAEWDFGGLPAWLLRDTKMKVRSNYPGYTEAVERYFAKLIPMVADLQHVNGGPIIAVQVENEFGSYSSEVEHLLFLKKLLMKHGIKELLFTSDNAAGIKTAPFYEEALPTVNFKKFVEGKPAFDLVKYLSPEFPLVVMEYWSGWFDHWEQKHADSITTVLASDLEQILKTGASVNFFMFHGGTNFGFMAGANWFESSSYKPDITSYDYIAPLSEAGDLTPKYEVTKALIQKYVRDPKGEPELPDPPKDRIKGNYGTVMIDGYLPLEDFLSSVKKITTTSPVTMEMLDVANSYGQNYGFVLYRGDIPRGDKLKFENPIQDRVQVILNGVMLHLFTWYSKYWEVTLPYQKQADENILDILVENHGRVNYVRKGFDRFNQERKGLSGSVTLDDKPITSWSIYPLEFKPNFINSLVDNKEWKLYTNHGGFTSLYKCTLTINATPSDTFINMKGWTKGFVFINGFNLGRYWKEGPQKTLYVPAPILKTGKNTIVIFELHKGSHGVVLQDTHVLS